MRKFLVSLLAAAILVPGAASMAEAAKVKPIRLTMATQYMDRHPVVQKIFKPWIQEVKEKTNGRVLITLYNPNTICPDASLYDSVVKGQVDIGEHFCNRTPGRFPLNSVIGKVPMEASNPRVGAEAYWKLYEKTPAMQEEFKDVKILALHTTATCNMHTKGLEVTKLEDLAGQRVLGISKDTTVITNSLGLNSLMQPSTEVYMAMSRNMADVAVLPVAIVRSLKVNECTDYTLMFNGILGSCWVAMNKDRWEALPDDVKKVFEETTGLKMSMAIGQCLTDSEAADMEILKKGGHKFVDIDAEEKVRWRGMIQPALRAAWKQELAKSTYATPDALYDAAVQEMKAAEAQYGNK